MHSPDGDSNPVSHFDDLYDRLSSAGQIVSWESSVDGYPRSASNEGQEPHKSS